MTTRTLTLSDALTVITDMRETDRACLGAMLGEVSDEVFAADRFQSTGPAWTLLDDDGAPMAVTGLNMPNAWSATAWLVARRGLKAQSWRKLVRLARTVLANAADAGHEQYRHRIEAHVLASWSGARILAQRLGFHYEGIRRGAGRRGEDIEVWAIVGPAKGD